MDRISQLPNDIIGNVLSLLPVKEAAATAFLSKTWESMVHRLPILYIDQLSYKTKQTVDQQEQSDETTEIHNKFCKTVDKCIRRCCQQDFFGGSFEIYMSGNCDPTRINQLLKVVAESKAKRLHLHFSRGDYQTPRYSLWTTVASKSLRVLHLSGCILEKDSLSSTQNPDCLEEVSLREMDSASINHFLEVIAKTNVKKLYLDFRSENEYKLPEKALSLKSLSVLHVSCCIVGFEMTQSIELGQLRELHLENVLISQGEFDIIIKSSPCILELSLIHCQFEDNHVDLSHKLLKKLHVRSRWKFQGIQVNTPSLCSFLYESSWENCELSRLHRSGFPTPNGPPPDVDSALPDKKSLVLDLRSVPESLHLTIKNVKILFLHCTTGMGEITIEAPNMQWLVLRENFRLESFFFSVNTLGLRSIHLFPNRVDTYWFRKLREFMRRLRHNKNLNLMLELEHEVTLEKKKLGNLSIPRLSYVKELTLRSCILSPTTTLDHLVEGLLWILRPSILTYLPRGKFLELRGNQRLRALADEHMKYKKSLKCCKPSLSKFWKTHYTKDVKVKERFGISVSLHYLKDTETDRCAD